MASVTEPASKLNNGASVLTPNLLKDVKLPPVNTVTPSVNFSIKALLVTVAIAVLISLAFVIVPFSIVKTLSVNVPACKFLDTLPTLVLM